MFKNLMAKKDSWTSPSGKVWAFEENKMILLALRGSVENVATLSYGEA